MRLTFRQGIAKYQTDVYATPTFLVKSGNYVNLNVSPDPTIIFFAHHDANYVVEELKSVTNAWGPFTGSQTVYLYWDINLLDASLTRGYTTLPLVVSAVAPNNPANDQHWFDLGNTVMKVWNGIKWVEKVRVFAGTFSSSAIIQPQQLGSQVGLTGDFDGGAIVLDSFLKPLRQSDGSFVTSATNLSVTNALSKTIKFEADILQGMANEFIPAFSLVQSLTGGLLALGRSDNWRSRVLGLVDSDLYTSEVGNVVSDGSVSNQQWSWPTSSIGRPVFCGLTGQVTTSPPVAGVLQPVGYIVDPQTIFMRIGTPTILDDLTHQTYDTVTQAPGSAPAADFTVDKTSGQIPLIVTATSTTLHNPTSLQWDFGNTGTFNGTGQTATYTFTAAGTYAIRLRATNSYGSDEELKTGLITVTAPASTGTNTNLNVQLGGPLQVAVSAPIMITVTSSNSGLKTATNVARVVTIDDLAPGVPVTIATKPTGVVQTHVGTTTILTFPLLGSLATGQYSNSMFTITAPATSATITLRAAVLSPETDSTLSDNAASLSIKVKP